MFLLEEILSESSVVLPCLDLPCLDLPRLDQPSLDMPCLALPCLDLPCLDLPCLDLPCLDLPCLDLPCLDLPCLELAATGSGDDWIDISNTDNTNTMNINFHSPHTTKLYEHFPSTLVSCRYDIPHIA